MSSQDWKQQKKMVQVFPWNSENYNNSNSEKCAINKYIHLHMFTFWCRENFFHPTNALCKSICSSSKFVMRT